MRNCARKIVDKYIVENDFERGLKELSERTGIKYLRLQEHLKKPGSLRLFEIKSIDDELHFSDEDLVKFIRG